MNITMVTAIFGGIDRKKIVPDQSLFVNEMFFDEKSMFPYKINGMFSDRTKALFFKAQTHKFTDADIIIWVDGKIQILSDTFVEQCVSALGMDYGVAILKHNKRSCIYEEVSYIEKMIEEKNLYLTKRYAHRPIREQVERYRADGYPEGNGLNDCCIICRRNNSIVNAMFDDWWQECKIGLFDQVSIKYQAWKHGVPIKSIEFKPKTFAHVPHILLK